jgi:hypothetical protein
VARRDRHGRLAPGDVRGRGGWRIDEDTDAFELRVVVPPNTDAQVHVPGEPEPIEVGSVTHTWFTDRPTATDAS